MRKRWQYLASLAVMATVVLSACGPLGGASGEKTIYVGPYFVDCVGVAPQKCLLVKDDPKGDWTMFYDPIDGFEYQEGFEYELRIREEKVENPPADASSIRWVLVEVVSQTRSLEGTNWVLDAYLDSEGVLVGALSDSQASAIFREGQVAGNASCNSYFGTYEVGGDRLSVDVGGMTEMYCMPEELMAQEGTFLAALDSAHSYVIAEDKLQIEDADGREVLVFSVLQPASLVGTRWLLSGYNNGKGGVVSVLNGTEITAIFDPDGRLTGSAGCNNYATSYGVSGDGIAVGPVASTMMMCPDPPDIMEQERDYLAALETVSTFQIEGDTMVMMNVEGSTALTYVASQPIALAGVTWQALGYNNGRGGVVSVIIGTEISVLFGEDGSLTGSAGCNNYMTSYEVDGESISVGPAATTRKYCADPEGIMQQESEYLAALEQAATYRIDGDRLQIRDAGGSLLADYVIKAESAGLDGETLKNLEYQSEWTQSGVAPLANGEYREQAAPGSATETVVMLTDHVVYGQLNGQDAAAVILVTNPGGSGTFYDLAVVVKQDGQPVNVATTSLGDRVQIQNLDIAGNEIIVEMVNQGPDDPMCCPTQQVVQTYALEGGQLVQTSNRVVGEGAEGESELTGVVWKWEQFLESNDNTVVVDDPEQYTIEFKPDGSLHIKADCNMVNGTYTLNGSQLSIQLGAMTMAMCLPDSLSDEYIRLLGDVVSYVIDGDKLALAIKYDTGIMTFIQ